MRREASGPVKRLDRGALRRTIDNIRNTGISYDQAKEKGWIGIPKADHSGLMYVSVLQLPAKDGGSIPLVVGMGKVTLSKGFNLYTLAAKDRQELKALFKPQLDSVGATLTFQEPNATRIREEFDKLRGGV